MKYRIDKEGSDKHTFEQTDWGRIYYSTPREVIKPTTIAELASILKTCNKENKEVTIRNAGHSPNGQTLTDKTQIALECLNDVTVDYEKMEVTAQSGATWDKIFKTINLTKYSTLVFPCNPGQQICIGGSASVGGIGFFSNKYGGIWATIQKIKLVTMSGKVLTCSPTENPEYFSYAIGGHGRIGVIAEVTIPIIEHSNSLLGISFLYYSLEGVEKDLAVLRKFDTEGITLIHQLKPRETLFDKVYPTFLNVTKRVHDDGEREKIIDDVRHLVKSKFLTLFQRDTDDSLFPIKGSLKAHHLSEDHFVYWYPRSHKRPEQLELYHPWADYFIEEGQYIDFVHKVRSIIKKYQLEHSLQEADVLNNFRDVEVNGCYIIKKNSGERYPLTPDTFATKADSYRCLSVLMTCHAYELERVTTALRELDDFCYEIGGKRYMYGYHNLTKEQVISQYGLDVIRKWNKIKNQLDPKGLLNKDVIEHLDTIQ